MPIYTYFAKTPELAALPSQQERDAVHSIAWRQLKSERPDLWTKSFWMIIGFGALACLLGYPIMRLFPGGPWAFGPFEGFSFFGMIGGGLGGVAHVHLIATALRPYYAEIISAPDVR